MCIPRDEESRTRYRLTVSIGEASQSHLGTMTGRIELFARGIFVVAGGEWESPSKISDPAPSAGSGPICEGLPRLGYAGAQARWSCVLRGVSAQHTVVPNPRHTPVRILQLTPHTLL